MNKEFCDKCGIRIGKKVKAFHYQGKSKIIITEEGVVQHEHNSYCKKCA